jgi:hypothetical protein
MRRTFWAFLALSGLFPGAALAQSPDDASLIPDIAREESAPSEPATPAQKRYLEFVPTLLSWRSAAPAAATPDWQSRASLSYAAAWDPTPRVRLRFSDRFSVVRTDGEEFRARSDLQNDVREAYLAWQPKAESVVQAGRINLRHGVALGFNPTDFLKDGTGLAQASADPTVAREGRLGVVLLRAQRFWTGGSVAVNYAPKLADDPKPGDRRRPFDLDLERTNAADRLLATADFRLADFNPQALVYLGPDDQRLGLNVTHLASSSTVVYAEWSGGWRRTLFDAALRDREGPRRWRNDFAVGLNWSNAATKLTAVVEYHRHGGGLSEAQRRTLATPGQALATQLVREEAAFRQEPLGRDGVFAMITRNDAFVENLTLGALGVADLHDLSAAYQLSAVYDLSDRWTVGLYLGRNRGGDDSAYGASAVRQAVSLDLVRYF